MFQKMKFKYQRLFSDRRLGAERVLMFGDYLGDPHTVAVDTSGNIVALMKGNDDGTLRTLKVDSNARMEAVMKGLFGATFKTLATDTNGNLIAILKGASGNDIAVDASGYLTAIMHGDQGAVAQDANNKLISVMQGAQGIDVAQQATTGELKSVMQGLEGATLRTVAVDGDGNIIGVFKGDYDGALKTLAVDNQGRMLAVLTDPEDVFGNPSYMGAAELAARLGSLNVYERRGQTLFMDGFENSTLHWSIDKQGASSYVRRSIEHAHNGDFSLKLYCASGAGNYSGILKRLNYTLGTKAALSTLFHMPTACSIDIELWCYDGTNKHAAEIRFNADSSTLTYYNSAGSWSNIASDLTYGPTYNEFNPIKLVIDTESWEYVRCFFRGVEYSLSGLGIREIPDLQAPALSPGIEISDAYDATGLAYIDNVILTDNEPA